MKSQFAIFGLERVPPLTADNKKSGQPYLFRKYPKHFESRAKADEELGLIMNGQSAYPHYKFSNYTVLEIIPASLNNNIEKGSGLISEEDYITETGNAGQAY
ncbi:MAG TPA: hypothetical protein VKT28_11020 [Puia sp.]|nr:hypothetical protein [Puia sp.]